MKPLPSLNGPRLKHCQIIIRDVLFIFFGHQKTVHDFSDTLEYLDLKDPGATFNRMQITNYKKYFVEPMIFPKDVDEEEGSKE